MLQAPSRKTTHLRKLVQAGIVEREQRGPFAYFRPAPDALTKLGALLSPDAGS
jgi:DNA-binding transcriptional ArsR family regulator